MPIVIRWLLLTGVLLGLSACYEDPAHITLHEAHVYKGKLDEHAGDPIWRMDQLRQRFRQVQTDR